jgi:hypothetical protein
MKNSSFSCLFNVYADSCSFDAQLQNLVIFESISVPLIKLPFLSQLKNDIR